MSFIADKQTLEDLNIVGRYKNNSMFRIFDRVVTEGGRKLMDDMFRKPLMDADAINQRCSIFKYFGSQAVSFPFTNEEFNVMENYLESAGGSNLVGVGLTTAWKKVLGAVAQDKEYDKLNTDVCKTVELLNVLNDFISRLRVKGLDNPYSTQLQTIQNIFADKRLQWLQNERGTKKMPLPKLAQYDYQLRVALRDEMKQLTDIVFEMDVYMSVSGVAVARGFSYPKALPKQANRLDIAGLYHPALEKAVANSISLNQESNLVFLTGANMAGKSTLMKSFGISIYLAHMGFPVAAEKMEFSVKDGLYSSINVPDNLDQGYSHFYAEVLRVKKVAEEVSESKDLIVIFDELFKGTNVKDAYDATLSITEAFSENRNCFFIISTHIIEVGEALRERCDNFQFTYLPTVMEGVVPRYTYKLKEGITSDRQGMIIIENEGILDIIRAGTKYELKAL